MDQSLISVTIIIPVFNDEEALKKLLPIITSMEYDYPVEIFVVDNASTDKTASYAETVEGVKLLRENNYINSPYSARNRGLESSNGNIIVLLDSTCIPSSNWLSTGVNYLIENDSDIVGGNVRFDFEDKLTAGKIYDSLTNIKMKESIENKGVAKTANLFIKRFVFDQIGMFPEGVRSGADVIWTGNAKRKGFSLDFCEEAVVYKKARNFPELIKKQWRVGLHQPKIWKELSSKKPFFSLIMMLFIPINPIRLWGEIQENGTPRMRPYYVRIVIVAQVIKWVSIAANIKGYVFSSDQ